MKIFLIMFIFIPTMITAHLFSNALPVLDLENDVKLKYPDMDRTPLSPSFVANFDAYNKQALDLIDIFNNLQQQNAAAIANSSQLNKIDFFNKLANYSAFEATKTVSNASKTISTSTTTLQLQTNSSASQFINKSRLNLQQMNANDSYNQLINKVLQIYNQTNMNKASSELECFNCTELKSKSECLEFDDPNINQLINIFCCQCNKSKLILFVVVNNLFYFFINFFFQGKKQSMWKTRSRMLYNSRKNNPNSSGLQLWSYRWSQSWFF